MGFSGCSPGVDLSVAFLFAPPLDCSVVGLEAVLGLDVLIAVSDASAGGLRFLLTQSATPNFALSLSRSVNKLCLLSFNF